MPCQLGDLKGALLDVIARSKEPAEVRTGPFQLEDAVPLLESCRFRFRTPDDIEKLVPLLARLFPDPDRTLAGISELMMNAIEHGNLEIGQERKADWVARGVYESELAKRLNTPPYSARWGEVMINKREDGVMIVIMDQGCGFCWQDLIHDQGDTNGAILEPNGRGIATAKDVSFDQLRFNHQGNQVTAFVSKENSW
jgi:anti-sigma regulatory factor (Ser/Thr protein kinase)